MFHRLDDRLGSAMRLTIFCGRNLAKEAHASEEKSVFQVNKSLEKIVA